MTTIATVTEVLRNFSDYINRVSYRGERFVLTRGGKEVAELVPAPPSGRPLGELVDVLAALPRLGAEEAIRFGEDLARAGGERPPSLPEDPWPS